MRLSLLFLAPLLLIACSTPTPSNPVVEDSSPTVIHQAFTHVLEGNFRGLFSFSNGQGYFTACDSNEALAVNSKVALRNIQQTLTANANIPVYIEFTGEIIFSEPLQKEDVLMRIDRVHHMAPSNVSLQCAKPVDNFLFKAQGKAPYWRVIIDNKQLHFTNKVSNQLYNVQDANFRTTQISHIKSTNKKDQRLKLTIQPGHCYNLKKREYWGYTTTVNSIWGEHDGCGEPGWPIEDATLYGYYLSSNSTINLTLNANHSVVYREQVNGSEILKTGFWKSNSPQQVVVMLSKQADKNIRQELLLQRSNLTLTTTEINNNNIVTTIDNGALVFNKMNAGEQVVEVKHIDRLFTPQHINPSERVDPEIQKALNNYFKIHRTDPKHTKFSAVKYDLNGDGIDEALVLLNWCSANSGCELLIFEGRKTGYRFSSRMARINAPIIISNAQHYQWQSLLVNNNNGWSQLTFDGLSYPAQHGSPNIVDRAQYSTGVVLFSQGRPTQWFPIK